MHQAVLENSIELVKLLIENNADVNIQDEDSWTPLHAACSMGYYEVAKFLLENKANVNSLTSENERPIDLVENGFFELISLLLSYINKTNSLDDYMIKIIMGIFDKISPTSSPSSQNDEKEQIIISEISVSFHISDFDFFLCTVFNLNYLL